MTESDIQFALYYYRRCVIPFPEMITNAYLYAWESDLLYISRNLYVTEWEIKLSRSDFKADMKKVRKHLLLSRNDGQTGC